jgi:hypothetical protein
MSIVDRPSTAPAAFPRRAPITLAMYDRMLAAGVFDLAESHPLARAEAALSPAELFLPG